MYHPELMVKYVSKGMDIHHVHNWSEQRRANLIGFGSFWETHIIDFVFGFMCIGSRFITCRYVVDMFRSTAITFFKYFFRTLEHLSDCEIVLRAIVSRYRWQYFLSEFFFPTSALTVKFATDRSNLREIPKMEALRKYIKQKQQNCLFCVFHDKYHL